MAEGASSSSDLGREAVAGLGWQLLATIVRFVARFGIGIALARLLFPDDFGVVGIASIATGFVATLANLGLGAAIIQREDISERHVRVCHTLSVATALLATLLLYVSAAPIAGFFDEPRAAPIIRVLSLMFPVSAFALTAGALLARELRFRVTVTIQLVGSILGYGLVAIVLAALGFGYWSLVAGTLVQASVSATLTFLARRHPVRPLVSGPELRDLFGFGAGISLATTANWFARQGDYLVIGRTLSAADLGFYSRAYGLMQLPLRFLGGAITRVMIPVASRVQGETDRFRRAFLTTFTLSVAFSLPVSLFLAITAPELILTLYGDRWARTIPLLRILALFGMFRMSFNTAAAFVQARGQAYRLLASQVVYAGLVLGGSWWGASVAGLEGVAWGVGAAITVMWGMAVVFAADASSVTIPELGRTLVSASAPGLGIGALVLGLAWLARGAGLPPWAVLLVTVPIFAAMLAGALLIQARRLDNATVNETLARVATALGPGVDRLRRGIGGWKPF